MLTGLALLTTAAVVVVPIASLTRDRADIKEADGGTSVAVPSPSPPASPEGLTTGRPDAEVAVGRSRGARTSQLHAPGTRIPERGPGTFEIAAASLLESQVGVTYRVEVEEGLPFDTVQVARFVEATLADDRSWGSRHRLVRVAGHADLRVVLATPETTDDLCAPLDTGGRLSCRNGEFVVLNAWRWQFGADGYVRDLRGYRRYVVNHETGHALGYPHVGCPGAGQLAPVMLQQTKGLAGCRPNPWPSLVDLATH